MDWWRDQSGNARDLRSAGATYNNYFTGIQNGLPAVRFDGAERFSSNSAGIAASAYITASAGTVFVVAGALVTSTDTATSYDNDGIWGASGGYAGTFFRQSTPYGYFFNWDGSEDKASLGSNPGSGWHIYTWMHGSGNVYGGMDDTRTSSLVSAASGNTSDLTGVFLLGVGYTNMIQGDFGEVVTYNTALSEDDRKLCETYLATRWGITLPYGAAAPVFNPLPLQHLLVR